MALGQSEQLATAIRSKSAAKTKVVAIDSVADLKRDNAVAAPFPGGPRDKLDWISNLQELIVSGEAEIAVHSGKDVPIDIHPETELFPVLPRSGHRDVLLLKKDLELKAAGRINGSPLEDLSILPKGSCVATSSLRRQAICLYQRSDLRAVPIRGNVPTRISKLEKSESIDALILAEAGLERLNYQGAYRPLSVCCMLPAVNQGILVAQISRSRSDLCSLLSTVTDPLTAASWKAERLIVETLRADCNSAMAVFAEQKDGGEVSISAEVYSYDFSIRLSAHASCRIDADSLARDFTCPELFDATQRLSEDLLAQGAFRLLEEARNHDARIVA